MGRERSSERGGHGLFTSALKQVWDNGRFDGTYQSFRDTIVQKLPPSQTPQISAIGDLSVDPTTVSPFTCG